MEPSLAKAANGAPDKKDFPPGKFVDPKGPNFDQLRRELANKNKQAPVSGRPVVSAGNVNPVAVVATPGKQKMRPASGRTPNRNQINQAKYKELLNHPGQRQNDFKPVFISESSKLAKLNVEKEKEKPAIPQNQPSKFAVQGQKLKAVE